MQQLNFENFIERHGESGVQAIIERLERYEGIRHNAPVPLEERWQVLMGLAPAQQRLAA